MLLTRCTCTCICAVVAVMLNTGNKASNKELVQHASFNHKKQAAFKTVTTVLWSKLSINVLDKMCLFYWIYIYILLKKKIYIYRVSQEECARLRKGVPYVKVYGYNPKHPCPKLNGYEDNDQRSLKLWQLLHTYWLSNTY